MCKCVFRNEDSTQTQYAQFKTVTVWFGASFTLSGKCSYCTCKAVDSVVCECVWAALGSVCSVAVQKPADSQSSHLPGDRREIEAVFAQLTPSHSQDKHTVLYTQAQNIRHLLQEGPTFHGFSERRCFTLTHSNCMNSVCVTYYWPLPRMLDWICTGWTLGVR